MEWDDGGDGIDAENTSTLSRALQDRIGISRDVTNALAYNVQHLAAPSKNKNADGAGGHEHLPSRQFSLPPVRRAIRLTEIEIHRNVSDTVLVP
jgi:hypothetical protein